MLVHEQLTISNSFCSVFPVITYIFNGTCVVVMHVQVQLCIIATSNLYNLELLYFITIIVTLIMCARVHAHSMLLFAVGSHLYTYYTRYAIKQNPCILLLMCVL